MVGQAESKNQCPQCGFGHTVRYGFNVTKKGRFPRRKCMRCGTTFYESSEGNNVEKVV